MLSLMGVAAFLMLSGSPDRSASAATIEITIEAIAFEKVTAPLKVGDTIVWINKDVVAHTATAKNSDWRVVIPANAKARLVLKKGGTVDYFCEYHPNMTGRLTIEP
jgi:plastocyanin